MTAADDQRQVHHIGPRQDLGLRLVLDELLRRQSALFLDQFALYYSENAAETLQRQKAERPEQVGQ